MKEAEIILLPEGLSYLIYFSSHHARGALPLAGEGTCIQSLVARGRHDHRPGFVVSGECMESDISFYFDGLVF